MGPVFHFAWWVLTVLLLGALMWASQVGPQQAASNLSEWLKYIGIENPPTWLKNKTADKMVRRYAFWALLAVMLAGGVMLGHSWNNLADTITIWGPREGDSSASSISIENIVPVERNPATDVPFFVNVYFRPSDEAVINLCHLGSFATGPDIASDEENQKNLTQTMRLLDVMVGAADCPAIQTRTFFSIYPEGVFPDTLTKSVKDGSRYLYVYVVWKYRLKQNGPIYVQTTCQYFAGGLAPRHFCAGNANRTFVHKENG